MRRNGIERRKSENGSVIVFVTLALVALLGFAVWIGGAVMFATRAVNKRDELLGRPAATSAIVVAIGLVVWLVGLHNA